MHTGLHPFDRDPEGDVTLYDVSVVCGAEAAGWVAAELVGALEERGYRVHFYCRDALVRTGDKKDT